MVRISDDHLSYAVYLDWCSFKEVYHIKFIKIPIKNKTVFKSGYTVKSCLIGKYDLLCPNLLESKFSNDKFSHEIINQQIKLTPNYKFIQNNKIFRDGFSLMVDQIRLDFDLDYFSNIPDKELIKFCFQNRSNIFDYEYQISDKVKKNISAENKKDHEFFQFLVIKVKMREEITENKAFTENQKFKLLRYFSKTI